MYRNYKEIYLNFAIIIFLCCGIIADEHYFTSTNSMEDLVNLETLLILNAEKSIVNLESIVNLMKIKLEILREEHEKAMENISNYVENPINAYLLTKRLAIDWRNLQNFLYNKTDLDLQLPVDTILNTNLEGAADALLRLHDTYGLNPSLVADGELNGIKYSSSLSWNDCFELGKHADKNSDIYLTLVWMREALRRLPTDETYQKYKLSILDYLSIVQYNPDNISEMVEHVRKVAGSSPQELIELINEKFKYDFADIEDFDNESIGSSTELSWQQNYNLLCRGNLQRSASKLRFLKCRYLDRKIPYLKLAPFKIEEVSLDPYMVIFYDVITDAEIKVIRDLAKPLLKRSNVLLNNGIISNTRISKTAWIDDNAHKYISGITQRVSYMTGLTLDTAEILQVANYGIGGFYAPHHDYFGDNGHKHGDRIATTLFYLANVEQGGATVFPHLNVTVWPIKGSAVLWYNLHTSGERDSRTLHSACPVLVGSKWIATKWIHTYGEEFTRPCELHNSVP